MSPGKETRRPFMTPIHEYAHCRRLSRISLVGLIHLAEPYYYEQIQTITDEKEASGAAVHYERVRHVPAEELRLAGAGLQRKVLQNRATFTRLRSLFEDLPLVRQFDALQIRDGWANHDVSELDLAERMSELSVRSMHYLSRFVTFVAGAEDLESRRTFVREAFAGLAASSMAGSTETLTGGKSVIRKLLLGNMDKAVLEYRNGVALQAVSADLHRDPDADFVLLWGAGHLQGMGQGLGAMGYRRVAERHIQAIDLAVI